MVSVFNFLHLSIVPPFFSPTFSARRATPYTISLETVPPHPPVSKSTSLPHSARSGAPRPPPFLRALLAQQHSPVPPAYHPQLSPSFPCVELNTPQAAREPPIHPLLPRSSPTPRPQEGRGEAPDLPIPSLDHSWRRGAGRHSTVLPPFPDRLNVREI